MEAPEDVVPVVQKPEPSAEVTVRNRVDDVESRYAERTGNWVTEPSTRTTLMTRVLMLLGFAVPVAASLQPKTTAVPSKVRCRKPSDW